MASRRIRQASRLGALAVAFVLSIAATPDDTTPSTETPDTGAETEGETTDTSSIDTTTTTEPELECEVRNADLYLGTPWQQERISSERAWTYAQGAGVTVAVIDTGVDSSTPQLRDRVLPGLDIVNDGGTADIDCDGHGTFVAGIIAAAPTAATGFAGVAPDATILPVRQANSNADGTAGAMATAIRYAVDNDADIINISAGAPVDAPVLSEAVDYAASNDVLIVAAMSNDAENGNPFSYPAAYPTVVAVGSIAEDGTASSFSGTSNPVDLVAPGENVVSLAAGTSGHAEVTGTSFSAAFVSGVAALVLERHPDLTAEQLRERLLITADHPGADRPDAAFGWGVVNPYRAVTAVVPTEVGYEVTAEGPAILTMPASDAEISDGARLASERFLIGLGLGVAIFLLFAAVIRARNSHRRNRSTPSNPDHGAATRH